MKKLVFNREKFSGSSIVIYASFSHASNLRCSMNIAENYSTCFNAKDKVIAEWINIRRTKIKKKEKKIHFSENYLIFDYLKLHKVISNYIKFL